MRGESGEAAGQWEESGKRGRRSVEGNGKGRKGTRTENGIEDVEEENREGSGARTPVCFM
jgi:hypothetical protein